MSVSLSALAGCALGVCCSLLGTPVTAQEIARVTTEPAGLRPLPARVQGRAAIQPDGMLLRQWPGTYFETAFHGDEVYFRVGAGDVGLRVSVDGAAAMPLVKPAAGLYRVAGLKRDGEHLLRVSVASESQGGPTGFGGFLAGAATQPAALPRRARQVEFIGDSHTVGYGNTSATRQCTPAEVWATTDTTQGVAGLVSARYGADFRVNAISGRGVVRNYDGFAADTLPQAYPFALFDRSRPADDTGWQPQVIAISLGTNDFSTPLRAGEPWATREQLREAYEAAFVRFIDQLHRRVPGAYVVLWIAAADGSEVQTAVARVVERVRRSGNVRIGFVPVPGLSMAGCDWHPSVADDRRIVEALARHLDAQQDVWPAAVR